MNSHSDFCSVQLNIDIFPCRQASTLAMHKRSTHKDDKPLSEEEYGRIVEEETVSKDTFYPRIGELILNLFFYINVQL